MAPATTRLAIDLSGSLIRIVDGAMGGPMKCGSGRPPDSALVRGRVMNAAAVGQAIKQLVARSEINDVHTMVAASDSAATFRILRLPGSAADKDVESAVAKALPLDPERLATRWIDVYERGAARVVYAVAWDREWIKGITDAVKLAGLDLAVVELKSAALARTVMEGSCVVLDLASDPVELVLVDRHLPQLWHSVELKVPLTDDVAPALATPLRSVLRYYKRSEGEFGPNSPVLIASEHAVPAQVLSRLAEMIDQPVRALPPPARVPPDLRHSTYLACLGLIMRRHL